MGAASDVAQIRARQVALYGEPLQAVLGRCAQSLFLTQARMSELLGISAPMLSQLINGHRIKIGNPAAAQRLQWMVQIAQQVDEGTLSIGEAMDQLKENAESPAAFRALPTVARRERHVAIEIQELCRLTACASDFLEAAAQLRKTYPEIAEFLTVFGTERADRAVEYANKLRDQASSQARPA